MSYKPKVYLTSDVFSAQEIGSNEMIDKSIRERIEQLWIKLKTISNLKVFNGRFPTESDLISDFQTWKPNFVGCHLSHSIPSHLLRNSDIFAISTSTAGYNHIEKPQDDDIIITHTPGVLHNTVADYTIALIMANLRNLINLNSYVWNGDWISEDKWDLDKDLSSLLNNKILGIVGLGEIGKELVKKLYPWDVKILYHDNQQKLEFEQHYPNIEYKENIEDIFINADIVSLHIPLNQHTEKIINRDLLRLMKKGALLVNTARGPVLDLDALLTLLEEREIQIDLAFDVFPIEPLDSSTLKRFKKIKKDQPNLRMILIPHNASADSNTRGKMNIIFLEDIIQLIESKGIEDLKHVHIIPEHRKVLREKMWRINKYWNKN